MIIDREAAVLIKDMFARAVKGDSCYKIAKDYNHNGVETVASYNRRVYGQNTGGRIKRPIWYSSGVSRILMDEFYIGTYVYHKNESTDVATRSVRVKDPNEWGRIEDHHEAIIDKDTYYRVQEILQKRSIPWAVAKHRYMLSGKVFCGICGSKLKRIADKKCFMCQRQFSGEQDGHRCRVKEQLIESAILSGLRCEIKRQVDISTIREKSMDDRKKILLEEEHKLDQMERSMDLLLRRRREDYEAYRLGDIDRDMFLVRRENTDEMQEDLATQIKDQKDLVNKLDLALEEFKREDDVGYSDLEELSLDSLTEELVDRFVNSVTVYPEDRIVVDWKFKG